VVTGDVPVQLVLRDVAVGYAGRPVLSGVTFTATAGVRLGLVGENGTGKTTLLRAVAGHLPVTSGELRLAGSLSTVGQELTVAPGTTIGDVVARSLSAARAASAELAAATHAVDRLAGDGDARLAATAADRLSVALAAAERLGVWDAERRADEALTRFGAPRDPARDLATLSVGERYRVRLACTIAERADVLLLDEPTNHLDAAGIDHLTDQLRAWPGIVLIVTHDRTLLDDVMTAILDLDPSMDGRPTLYGQSSYATYRFARAQALRRWRARYAAERKRAAALADRLDEAYEGLSDEWRPPKGSQANRRATRARIHVKAADRLVQRLEAQAVEVPVPPLALTFPDLPAVPAGTDAAHPLLEVRGVHVPGRLDLPGVRVDLPACGRLLVTGPNGSGKSTLLGVLAGLLEPARGVRRLAPGVRLGLLGQDDGVDAAVVAAGSAPDRTGFECYAAHALALLDAGRIDPAQLVPVMSLGLLTEEDLDRPLRELSVGQRRRFDLACSLLAAPHVLLLDEPTNHLSVALVDELTQALVVTSAAVVVATHDRALRRDLAHWPELALGPLA
jgi:macrolide transport system ATP-binding/permease protein